MRPRNAENRDLPPGMYRRKRTRKNGSIWVAYYYRDVTGTDVPLGKDIGLAKIKWADLEAKIKPADLTMMRAVFDRYADHIIPKKSARTQRDNKGELKQLRLVFDTAPIDSITPAMIAGYRDSRTAKVRANREIALLSHVFNTAREWGLTDRENPCQGVRKNKEKPRDYYANDQVWTAVYLAAAQELKDAMDLAYLTGQRPADVRLMGRYDVEGIYLLVSQGKTERRLRIQMEVDGVKNTLGVLIERMNYAAIDQKSPYFITNSRGQKISERVLGMRWDDARKAAVATAIAAGDSALAEKIAGFQFRDIRPKAASEILDIEDASRLLGHSKQEITKKVYRRVGAIAQPSK